MPDSPLKRNCNFKATRTSHEILVAMIEKMADNGNMELLEGYQRLCETVQSLLIQESTALKQGELPSTELLQKKADLLPQLEAGVQALKSVDKLLPEDKKIVQKIQQKIMKMLILDQENEKLLLALQMSQQLSSNRGKVRSDLLKSLYGKN